VYRLPGSVGVLRADAAGDVTWLAELPGMAIFVNNPGDVKQMAVGAIAFSPEVERAASGGAVWYGESGADSLIRYDAKSGQRSTIPLPFASQAPTAAMVATARAREMATLRDGRGRAFMDAKFSSAYLPRTLPYFGKLMPGPEGELWIQEFAGVPGTATRYLVVGADMKLRAWVNMPKGFRIAEVGRDFVLGVHEDDDGVESVRLYRLTRS
jgi:streptogramin lyase